MVMPIRCPSNSLAASACEIVGQPLPDDGGAGWIAGLGEIPCTGDILLITGRNLYRYDILSGVSTMLYDVGVNASDFRNLRKVVVRVAPSG